MSGWNPEPTPDWETTGGDGAFVADTSGDNTNGDWGSGDANDFENANGSGGLEGACRNCGQEGHYVRDCPEPKKLTGECFNCGEVGHNKNDCTNPKVDRPFTGTCNVCSEQGHRASDCPTKPKFCKNCQTEGHKTGDCTEKRKLVFPGVPDIEPEQAWEMLVKADKERDLDDFKTALKAYGMKVPDLDFALIESTLREDGLNVHLIALEREVPDTYTIIDLQGNTGRKYTLGFYFSAKPRRGKAVDTFPKTPEENLERLKNAGFLMDGLVIKCDRCGELGHLRKSCKQEDTNVRVEITCALCSEVGHRARDCTQPRVDRNACRNCKQSGHKATDCPEPRSAEGVECRKYNEMGHFSKDCPSAPSRACRNCGEEGHISKECEKPRNPDNAVCRNCDETGHFSRDCPKPRDYSRVTCQNCGENGHTRVRCKQPPGEGAPLVDGADAPPVAEGNWDMPAADGGWNDGGDTGTNIVAGAW